MRGARALASEIVGEFKALLAELKLPTWIYAKKLFAAGVVVHATIRQLGPGLGLTGPPPAIVFPFISQIEAWPLVF
jgi:hypothetical protein